MSTANEILKRVKAVFLGETVTPVVVAPVAPAILETPTPAIYKLKDGTEISIAQAGENPSPGDMVMIAGEPAPMGEHELEDGSKITVDVMGMVTLFTPAEPITTDLQDQPVPTMEERIASIESKIALLTSPVIPTGLATELQLEAATGKIEKHEATITGLFELVEKLVSEPTADPVTLTGRNKDKFEKQAQREERYRLMAETLKTNKALA